MKRILDLTLRVADGTATEAEVRELERLTESDRQARRVHLEMMEVEAALRASRVEVVEGDRSLAEERTVHAVMEGVRRSAVWRRPSTRRWGTRPIWAAAGMVGVAACAAFLLMPRPTGKRRPGSAPSPQAFGRSRAPGAEGGAVAVGRSAGWAPAPMRFRASGSADLSRLALDEGVALEVRGGGVVRAIERPDSPVQGPIRISADEGTFVLEVERDAPPRLLFATPHAEVVLRARRALLTLTADGTRIDVHEGTAVVKRASDGRAVELGEAQTVLVAAEEALLPRRLPTLLFVQGARFGRHPTDLLDGALVRHLEGQGFLVQVADEADVALADLAGKALVMISPSASDLLGDRMAELGLADADVPILCSRPDLYADLGLAPPGEDAADYVGNATRLEIVAPAHPLAAGLAGPVQVTRAPGHLGWAQPGPGAVRVAAFPDARKSNRASIFGYERGAPLVSAGRAPARRVGFFIHPDLGPYFTDAGWALLDAAVRWAADEQEM
jgi:hypothetical protein